jgi:hypothetical protein
LSNQVPNRDINLIQVNIPIGSLINNNQLNKENIMGYLVPAEANHLGKMKENRLKGAKNIVDIKIGDMVIMSELTRESGYIPKFNGVYIVEVTRVDYGRGSGSDGWIYVRFFFLDHRGEEQSYEMDECGTVFVAI